MPFAPSVLVSAIALVGAASLSVVATPAWLALSEVMRSSVSVDGRGRHDSLGRLYWDSLSPLATDPFAGSYFKPVSHYAS